MILAAAGESSGAWALALPVLLLVLFYFVAIRPSQKQRRQVSEVQNRLEPGLEVMTGSGIFGMILRIEDDVVVLEIADGVQIRILRQSIVRVIEAEQPSEPDGDASGPSAP